MFRCIANINGVIAQFVLIPKFSLPWQQGSVFGKYQWCG